MVSIDLHLIQGAPILAMPVLPNPKGSQTHLPHFPIPRHSLNLLDNLLHSPRYPDNLLSHHQRTPPGHQSNFSSDLDQQSISRLYAVH